MDAEKYEEIYAEFIHEVSDDELVDHLAELRITIDNLSQKHREMLKFIINKFKLAKGWYDRFEIDYRDGLLPDIEFIEKITGKTINEVLYESTKIG